MQLAGEISAAVEGAQGIQGTSPEEGQGRRGPPKRAESSCDWPGKVGHVEIAEFS